MRSSRSRRSLYAIFVHAGRPAVPYAIEQLLFISGRLCRHQWLNCAGKGLCANWQTNCTDKGRENTCPSGPPGTARTRSVRL